MRAPSDAIRGRARHWPRALLRDVPEIFEVPQWQLGWITVAAVLLLAAKSLVTTGVGELDLVTATRARVLSPAITVRGLPNEPGVIGAVRVREGQAVRSGEVLLRIASTAAAETITRLERERSEALMDMRRMDALLAGDPRLLRAPAETDPALVERARSLLATQMQARQARVGALRASIARDAARRAEIASDIANMQVVLAKWNRRIAVEEALAERKFVSAARLARIRGELDGGYRGHLALERQLAEADTRIASAEAILKRAAPEFRAQAFAQRARAAQRLEAASRSLALRRSELKELSAPADGFVHGVSALAIGRPVTGAEALLQILPADGEFEIEAGMPSRILRWMVEGQRVRLLLAPSESGDASKVDGEITWIAREAVHEARLGLVYPVRVRIASLSLSDPSRVSALAADTGTRLSVEIRLDARSMLDWLMQTWRRRIDHAVSAWE